MRHLPVVICALLFWSLPPLRAAAQNRVALSGLSYIDYSYTLSDPDPDAEGDNGFGYRRLYLTADFDLSDRFSGRARLEANDGSTTAQGRPAPFVKDLYVKWSDAIAEGHDLVLGISSPPAFGPSEQFWSYRSIEKTILDLNGVLSSRDFGLKLTGNLTADGVVGYGLMVANNNGVSGENDKHKRLYGQLVLEPADALVFSVSGDYASYGDERANGFNIALFGGYYGNGFRLGAEGFYNQVERASGTVDERLPDADGADDLTGISLISAVALSEKTEAFARLDFVSSNDAVGTTSDSQRVMLGVAVRPHTNVRIIPNLMYTQFSQDDDPSVTGRLTVHVDF